MNTTLKDFEDAARHDRGVEVIPFPDIRREATSIADEVQDRKIQEKWNVTNYERQKINLLKKKEEFLKKIEEEKEEMEEMLKKTPDFDVSLQKRKVAEYEREVADLDKKITAMNEELAEGVEQFQRLHNARGGLREIFEDTLDMFQDVRDDPLKYIGKDATEDDKKTLEKCLEAIEKTIKKEEGEHDKHEQGAQKTEASLRALIARTTT